MVSVRCQIKLKTSDMFSKQIMRMRKVSVLLLVFLMFIGIGSELFAQESPPYALFRQRKYQEAIAAAQELIKKDPSNIDSYAVIGWSYNIIGQWKQTLVALEAAERRAPNDPRIIEIIGEAYFQLRNDDKALEYFSKYLKLTPNGQLRSWVYYYTGLIYMRQDKLNKAEISIMTAVSLEKKKVDWWVALARVYEAQEDSPKALETYRQVLALDSTNLLAKKKVQDLISN